MITLTKAELQWLINAAAMAKYESLEGANDVNLEPGLRAICQLNADNMLSIEVKLINARDSGAKRIAIQ